MTTVVEETCTVHQGHHAGKSSGTEGALDMTFRTNKHNFKSLLFASPQLLLRFLFISFMDTFLVSHIVIILLEQAVLYFFRALLVLAADDEIEFD